MRGKGYKSIRGSANQSIRQQGIREPGHQSRTTNHDPRITNKENKANLLDAQMNVSSVKTMNYEQIATNNANKNKPNLCHRYQTQPVVSLSNLFQRQKHAGAFDRVALQAKGFVGRVWARGYDKRYCFDEESLKDRMDYVGRHKQLISERRFAVLFTAGGPAGKFSKRRISNPSTALRTGIEQGISK